MNDEQRSDDLDLGGGEAAATGAEDPLAGIPAEPIEDVSAAPEEERLGGEGAEIGEPGPGEVLEEPEEPDLAEPLAEEDAEKTAEPDEEPPAEKTAEQPPVTPPVEEPKKPAKKSGKKAPKTQSREYEIIRIDGDALALPLKAPVKARNGDDAIKEAYKALAESAEETMTLVAVPTGYWNPKEVKGRKKEDYAVEVG